MARRTFTQVPYQYGDGKYGVAIGQTRDGVEELVTLSGQMVLDETTGLWVPVTTSNRLPVEATLSGRIDALHNTIATGSKTVTSTAAEIFAGSSRLNGRHAMVITNTGNNTVYIGASNVSVSNGFPVFPQDTIRIEFDPQSSVAVFAVSNGPNVEIRVVELA